MLLNSDGRRNVTRLDRHKVALIGAIGLVVLVAVRRNNYQWDFSLSYGSANDFLDDVSPYRGEGLSFYQTPLTLYLYSLPARLPYFVAYELWLVLKVCALGGLLWVWNRSFVQLGRSWWTVAYLVLAYAGALYADLVAGNVSIFEQFGLWLGFAALMRGQYGRFCVCIILVSQFKLTPAFFAVTLLLVPKVPQWKWFAVCITGFLAVFSLNFILEPTLTREFFDVAQALDERGTESASTLAFVRDALDLVGGATFSADSMLDEVVYGLVALAVAGITLLLVTRHRRAGSPIDQRWIIFVTCVAYCLMVPRLKNYSYIIMLVPTLHLLRELPRRQLVPAAAAVLAFMAVFPHGNTLLPFYDVAELLYDYLPLVTAFAVGFGYWFLLDRVADERDELSSTFL